MNKNYFSRAHRSTQWTKEDETELIKYYNKTNLSLVEMHLKFPTRTYRNLKDKISQLKQRGLITRLPRRKPWTQKELKTLETLMMNYNTKTISNYFPNRTIRAIEGQLFRLKKKSIKSFSQKKYEFFLLWSLNRLQNENQALAKKYSLNQNHFIQQEIQKYISLKKVFYKTKIDWDQLLKKKFLAVSPHSWPRSLNHLNRNLCFLIRFELFKKTKSAICFIQSVIKEATNKKKDLILLYITDPQTQTHHSELPVLNNAQLNFIYVSLLGDGSLKRTKNTISFEFGQGALTSVNGISHLPYVIWVMNYFPKAFFSSSSFVLTRGIKLKQPRNGITHSWKAKIVTYLHKVKNPKRLNLESLYNENYLNISKNLNMSEQRESRNYKVLPENLSNYFINPGFSLAHLYMQDGALNNPTTQKAEPTLHIYTTDIIAQRRFAKFIFEKTCLKWVPKKFKAGNNREKTVLYLCSDDIKHFINLIKKYLLPCFFYKLPQMEEEKN